MATIGRLARRFGLSRSTLLYYDRIGLLHPTGRTGSGYRDYSKADAARLEKICLFRASGLPLRDIGRILDGPPSALGAILEVRLTELAEERRNLQRQQELICGLLKRELPEPRHGLTKTVWTDLLAASGFDRSDMRAWHVAFEQTAPDKHRKFLEFLNIPELEISEIRRWSAASRPADLGDRA